MIFDTIPHAYRYRHVGANIAKALGFISIHSQDYELKDGVYIIVPDKVMAHVVTKDTLFVEQTKMEIHKQRMDIHYMLCGTEVCGFADTFESSDGYDSLQDIEFGECKDETHIVVKEETFYAVWPEELHRPLICEGEPRQVRKIICKVLIEQ